MPSCLFFTWRHSTRPCCTKTCRSLTRTCKLYSGTHMSLSTLQYDKMSHLTLQIATNSSSCSLSGTRTSMLVCPWPQRLQTCSHSIYLMTHLASQRCLSSKLWGHWLLWSFSSISTLKTRKKRRTALSSRKLFAFFFPVTQCALHQHHVADIDHFLRF